MRLIDSDDLINAKPEFMNEKIVRVTKYQTAKDRIYAKAWNACNSYWLNTIKNASTVDFPDWYKVYEDVKGTFERPQGECRSCRHHDPEDKRCDCGGQERQGCHFPVSDDYYCKYYERGGEDRYGVSYLHQDSITKSDTHL